MLLLILQSLSKWLEIKAVRAHWDLSKDIEHYCEITENAIINARASGDDSLADRLRARLARASGIAIPSLGGSAPVTRADVSSSGK